jgi:RNA 2',3'-cyclic 3'-phosphodiesterase
MSARRLFFALWPTAAMQSELAAAVRAAMGSVHRGWEVQEEKLHLTLAFLGSVPEPAIVTVRESARQACRTAASGPPSLELTLDTIDYWPRSQVLCATASRETAGAAELAEGLKQSLSAAGFTPDLKPFRAHVTLARQVRERPPAREMSPVRWTFGDFALVESRTGASGSLYSVLDSWPLCRA